MKLCQLQSEMSVHGTYLIMIVDLGVLGNRRGPLHDSNSFIVVAASVN